MLRGSYRQPRDQVAERLRLSNSSLAGLADRNYYKLVSSGIQALCAAAEVKPCLLDAAIFSSFDNGRWNAANMEEWGYTGA